MKAGKKRRKTGRSTDEFVEGTFEFEGYNPDLGRTICTLGEFGLKMESFEQNNK